MVLNNQLPSSIGLLTSLTELNLAKTYLNGTVPVEITHLLSLTKLILADNDLSGEMPDLNGLFQLNVLDLSNNENLTVLTLDVPQGELLVVMPEEPAGLSTTDIITVSAAVVIIVALLCALLAYKCYFQAIIHNRAKQSSVKGDIERSANAPRNPRNAVYMPMFILKLIGSKKLRITKKISQGGFGIVYIGVYEGRDVAVKQLIVPKNKRDKMRLALMFRKHLSNLTYS
jgi:Leucine-rich repeat (LRR) protein